jgi:hypothetical protein
MINEYVFYREDEDVVMRCSISAFYNMLLELKKQNITDDLDLSPEKAVDEMLKGENTVKITFKTE